MKFNHMWKILLVGLCVVAILTACAGQGNGDKTTNPSGSADHEIRQCSITITNEAGSPMELLTVMIYNDAACSEIVAQRVTNAEGKVSFAHSGPVDGCVAVIQNAPVGYVVEKSYPVNQQTDIVLKACAPVTEAHLNTDERLLSLGDAMLDLQVTAADGTECSLSEALKTHDAVFLNFWYMNCAPCKMEFPHLQEAYEQFEGKVAVIALNPYDSNNASIETFRQENSYTFLMGKCDEGWAGIFGIDTYPLSLMIDRYGHISLIHNGSVDTAATFVKAFRFFTAEDYQQTFVRSFSQLPDHDS